MLFHEVYSTYYHTASIILREAVRGTLTGRDINSLVQKYAFGESMLTIPDAMKGKKWRLLRRDLSTSLREEPYLPLTTLEKRWMKAVLLDPRIQLFKPDMTGLENIDPLFTPEMIVYYDRYSNGDDYTDAGYIRLFNVILDAIRERRNLIVSFRSGRQAENRLTVTPYYLEYSEKDDCFRLIAGGYKRRLMIRLSRIRECVPADQTDRMILKDPEMGTVTFELEDRRNALDRVLLHFSHLEKETKRLDENHYRVTLRFDRQDETEMIIRILSFGAVIRVTEPESFVLLLRERIKRQIEPAT